MNNISIKIDFNIDTPIYGIFANSYNRISNFKGGDYKNTNISKSNNNSKLFILGSTKLGTRTYNNSFNGLVAECGSGNNLYDTSNLDFDIISYKVDNNNDIIGLFTINILANQLKSITIKFNDISNEFATVLKINKTIVTNNSPMFRYEFSEPQNNINVSILALNTPMTPIQIDFIGILSNSTYDKSTIKNITRGSIQTNNNGTVNYGLISQYGDIQIIDKDNSIKDAINKGYNIYNANVSILLDNNIIGTYISQDKWNYNNNNKIVSIPLQDNLIALQNSYVELLQNDNDNYTLLDIFNYIKNNISNNYNIIISDNAINKMSKIKVHIGYLLKDTIWNQLNKICQLAQLTIYTLPNGNINIDLIE